MWEVRTYAPPEFSYMLIETRYSLAWSLTKGSPILLSYFKSKKAYGLSDPCIPTWATSFGA
jgi:hypothetical protein